MQTLVKTNAAAMSEGEVIRTRAGDGLSWVIVTCKSWDGSTHYMVCLCAERHETHGRKKLHYYEWLGFRDMGKTFEDRDAAVAYIASQD